MAELLRALLLGCTVYAAARVLVESPLFGWWRALACARYAPLLLCGLAHCQLCTSVWLAGLAWWRLGLPIAGATPLEGWACGTLAVVGAAAVMRGGK